MCFISEACESNVLGLFWNKTGKTNLFSLSELVSDETQDLDSSQCDFIRPERFVLLRVIIGKRPGSHHCAAHYLTLYYSIIRYRISEVQLYK